MFCDLSACKGACCVDGDAGAPLDKTELKKVDEVFEQVLPYLRKEGIDEINKQGRYVYNEEYGWVTPTIESKICVYGIIDENAIVKCGIEQAHLDGKQHGKTHQCHLFPVIVKKSSDGITEYANYEPREDHCKAACTLGKKIEGACL